MAEGGVHLLGSSSTSPVRVEIVLLLMTFHLLKVLSADGLVQSHLDTDRGGAVQHSCHIQTNWADNTNLTLHIQLNTKAQDTTYALISTHTSAMIE